MSSCFFFVVDDVDVAASSYCLLMMISSGFFFFFVVDVDVAHFFVVSMPIIALVVIFAKLSLPIIAK